MLPVQARAQLALQVVRAVAHAHGRLFVHRDIKLGNVLFTGTSSDRAGLGKVRLEEFGLAQLMEQGSAEATALIGRATLA